MNNPSAPREAQEDRSMAEDTSQRREQRPATQTVLIVHEGKTHLGLDVQIGRPRRRRTDETQGELFE